MYLVVLGKNRSETLKVRSHERAIRPTPQIAEGRWLNGHATVLALVKQRR